MKSLTVVALALVATTAHADKSRLDEVASGLATACGARIAVSYDPRSETTPGRSPDTGYEYCTSIVQGLASACSDPAAKQAMAEAITSVRCMFQAGASKDPAVASPGGPVMKHVDGALTASFDWGSSNLESEAYQWVVSRMLVPGPNGPVTVEARKEKAKGDAELSEAIAAMNGACRATVGVTYDFASEKGHAAKPAWQGALYCKNVVDGLKAACEADHVDLGAKVKALTCAYQEGASADRSLPTMGGAVMGLDKTALRATYDWSSSNLDSAARTWAVSKLK